jgi:hypothetical protein
LEGWLAFTWTGTATLAFLLTFSVLAFTLTSTQVVWSGAIPMPSIPCFLYNKIFPKTLFNKI